MKVRSRLGILLSAFRKGVSKARAPLRFVKALFTGEQTSRSLQLKLLLPLLVLMAVALLGGVLAFSVGLTLIQEQLLRQQAAIEARDVAEALALRLDNVNTGAQLLAEDPEILEAVNEDGEEALRILNRRAVVLRERFDFDLIQIYDRQGTPRVNLMLSELYRESTMLEEVAVVDKAVILPVEGRLLMLRRLPMVEDAGTVLVGIDLATELRRITAAHRLLSELGVRMGDVGVATQADFPFEEKAGYRRDTYIQHEVIPVSTVPLHLTLVRPIGDIRQVAMAGLTVMVSSILLTTLLLSALNVVAAQAIIRPVHKLSEAAEAVSGGDLTVEVTLDELGNLLNVGHGDDEIALLARDFNSMVRQIRDLYANLEAKVEARTAELALAAELARAVSSSLDPEEVLRRSATLIHGRLQFDHLLIFLLRPEAHLLVLAEAADLLGASLKEQGYRLPVTRRSIVSVAATTHRPCIVQDLVREMSYLRISLLPSTGSAAAFPLMIQDTALGVLYIHVNRRGHFTPERVELLMGLAGQIAVGLHNAQLYSQQRETAERLAEVDRLKTEFIANMSHELRTPLNSIIGFSKLLLKEVEGPLNSAQAQELHIIHKAGQHLLSMINDVLDFSKVNAGKMQLHFEAVDMAVIAREALKTIDPLVENKPIELRLELAPDLPLVRADPRRAQQILLNLLSNAAKFTKQGSITVRLRTMSLYDPHRGHFLPYLEISVNDTGIGIPEDRQDDIFEAFTQVDSSTARKVGGTGLGLPLTKKLVELHGGKIWVESSVGKGTTFTVLLSPHEEGARVSSSAGVREALVEKSAEHE